MFKRKLLYEQRRNHFYFIYNFKNGGSSLYIFIIKLPARSKYNYKCIVILFRMGIVKIYQFNRPEYYFTKLKKTFKNIQKTRRKRRTFVQNKE